MTLIKCEWITCKHNIDSECCCPSITLIALSNSETKSDIEDVLNCTSYEVEKC